MADPTRPPIDSRNQPADQKLINDHPELLDPSLRGIVPGPQAREESLGLAQEPSSSFQREEMAGASTEAPATAQAQQPARQPGQRRYGTTQREETVRRGKRLRR